MTAIYGAPAYIRKTVIDVVREHYPDLARVHIAVLAIETADTPQAVITAKIPGPTARAAGAADVGLLVHSASFEEASEAERLALVDHALAGLTVVHREGLVQVDSAGRPRVKRRRPAFQAAVFTEVLERHQDATPGARAATEIRKRIDKARRGNRVKVKTPSILPDSLAG